MRNDIAGRALASLDQRVGAYEQPAPDAVIKTTSRGVFQKDLRGWGARCDRDAGSRVI